MTRTRRDLLKAGLSSVSLPFIGWDGAAAQSASRFVFANNSPYDNLDPHTIFDVSRAAIRFNLYDGLYRWVDNPPKLIPWLAESHSVSDDGKTYTFKLRRDVAFHDGKPLTSADVVYSVERILALKRGPSSVYADVVKPGTTQSPDPHTVVFNLVRPSAIFLATVPDILVVNSTAVKANEKDGDWAEPWLARNEAGSGSYALRRHDPAIGFTARRFPEHFAGWTGQPLDELEFRTVLETNTRVLGLIRGDFQGADGYMPYDQIQRLRQSPNVQVIEQESMRVFGLALNNSKPPMDDVHFRRALAHAFDYDGFINDIMKGSVSRNPGPNPNTIWGTPAGLKGYRYDLDEARSELRKVTAPLRPITLNPLAGFSESEQAAVLFQNSLRQVGIEAVVEVSPWPVIAARFNKPETMADVIPVWKSTFYVDPNNWVGELFGTRYHGPRTFSYYSNPEFDRRLDQALVSSNSEERRRLYEEMTQMVYDDAAGIFVYNTRWYGPYSSKVEGIRFSPVSHGQDLRWASLKR
ncbi:ABC transporter substrate-binding protein [Bosea sp. BK604]|uniref:ABC transporter substrate-binding protein n=1 Tax=Bosea sp. BK604 TaxID=2512180 RepID=UPI001042C574|nr:ABC transporter substrate-binding protein [Bosea sp. BK604]TCR61538.1 peptide/nickel transport system substrate-binding protein [Bosea sp. BK604]